MAEPQDPLVGEDSTASGAPEPSNGYCAACLDAFAAAMTQVQAALPEHTDLATQLEIAQQFAAVCPRCLALATQLSELRSAARQRGFSLGI